MGASGHGMRTHSSSIGRTAVGDDHKIPEEDTTMKDRDQQFDDKNHTSTDNTSAQDKNDASDDEHNKSRATVDGCNDSNQEIEVNDGDAENAISTIDSNDINKIEGTNDEHHKTDDVDNGGSNPCMESIDNI